MFQSLTFAISAFTLIIFSPQRTREMLSPCLAPLELPERVEKPMIKKTTTTTTKETRKTTTTRASTTTATTTTARVVATTKTSVRIASRIHVTDAVMIAEVAVVTIDEVEEEMPIVEVVEATDEAAEEMTTDEAAEETMIVEEKVEADALSIPLRLIV